MISLLGIESASEGIVSGVLHLLNTEDEVVEGGW